MSLRLRLVVVVVFALGVSLALGGVIVWLNASRQVRTEMHAALIVGRQTVDDVARGISVSPDPEGALENLVVSFRGNRHLRVSVIGEGAAVRVRPTGDKSPFGTAPAWFVRLIGVAPETSRVPITVGGRRYATVVIETDPYNESLEVWNALGSSLVVVALFCSQLIALILLFIGCALQPLDRLAVAMEQVGQGDYQVHISGRLTPELARLHDSFNRMAVRLAEADANNRRLNEQMLILQEEERNDIARDLHDEIGPFLFAIGIDAANIMRLLKGDHASELSAPVQSIAEATRHVQQQVRGMLGRLRPLQLSEIGLAEAVQNLVEFWKRRYPDIAYQATVAPDCRTLGARADTTVYRLVQECLSNAVRHGRPQSVTVCVDRDPTGSEVIVKVVDDGLGSHAGSGAGYGLIGMGERVRAMGGRLTFSNRSAGGFAVCAALPCASGLELVPLLRERF